MEYVAPFVITGKNIIFSSFIEFNYFNSDKNIGTKFFGNFIFLSFVKKYLQLYLLAVAQWTCSNLIIH